MEEYLLSVSQNQNARSPIGLKQTARRKLKNGDPDQLADFEEWKKDKVLEVKKAKELEAAERFGQQQLIGYEMPDSGIVAEIIGIENTERDGVPGFRFGVTLETGAPQSIFVFAEKILEEVTNGA